eukprot:gene13994-1807_t
MQRIASIRESPNASAQMLPHFRDPTAASPSPPESPIHGAKKDKTMSMTFGGHPVGQLAHAAELASELKSQLAEARLELKGLQLQLAEGEDERMRSMRRRAAPASDELEGELEQAHRDLRRHSLALEENVALRAQVAEMDEELALMNEVIEEYERELALMNEVIEEYERG